MPVERFSHVGLSATFLCCLLWGLAACEAERSPPASDIVAPRTDLVQWLFAPTPMESAALDSLLAAVHVRYSPARAVLSGQVVRLSTRTDDQRFLLTASVRETPSAADSVKLFLLTLDTVSEPAPMSIVDLPNRFMVTTIRDLDDDGLTDVTYCVWEGPAGSEGIPRAIGYRHGQWYHISDVSLPGCGLLPAP